MRTNWGWSSVCIVALFAVAPRASAQLTIPDSTKWRLVTFTAGFGAAVFLERKLPVLLGSKRIAWSLWDYDVKNEQDVVGETKKAARVLRRTQYDCQLQRDDLLSIVFYARDGEVIRTRSYDPVTDAKWEDVAPGSIGEDVLTEVCRKS